MVVLGDIDPLTSCTESYSICPQALLVLSVALIAHDSLTNCAALSIAFFVHPAW